MKIGKICATCKKPKRDDCDRCKPKPYDNIDQSNYSFYNSYKWRQKSKSFRKRNPLCDECLKNGRTTPSEMVDHIKPISKGGDKWNDNNLRALCNSCHGRKTGKSK